MIKIDGSQTNAIVFTNSPQETAIEQIKELCNQEFLKDTKIRIMPDYHAGKGCVIGTTIVLKDKVVPNLVGVDVGCGVKVVKLNNKDIAFSNLDKTIREFIPSGTEVHEEVDILRHIPSLESHFFKAKGILNDERTNVSLGTLGGGNHFIEVSKDDEGHHYLLIHTGSRYLGAKVAQYYQKQAIAQLSKDDTIELINLLKEQGRHSEIQAAIVNYKKENPVLPKDLAYLEGELFDDYIHDMKLAQKFAVANRQEIADVIIEKMKFEVLESFDTIHNYIDTDNMILRKGAVSAQKGEQLVIPINMRDGSIIAIGKGNPDWNYSAPHGAGRVFSRTQAMKNLDMQDFKDTMKDVWTTSVTEETLDEAPMAYKSMEEIMSNIGDTVDVVRIIKPVYNFKASDKWVSPNSKAK